MMLTRRRLIAGSMALAAMPAQARRSYAIAPVPVADGIWMIHGADAPIEPANGGAIANIAIIATPAGTVLCDCGPSLAYGQALRKVAEGLTGQPVVRVYVTHLHPDHGMGIAAFDPRIVAALPGTIEALAREGRGYSDAMYRLLNDWMRGTELVLPGRPIAAGREEFGGRGLRLLALSGHSGADLALLDERSGVLIGGDLVFHDRAPSTPTADLPGWRASLDRLAREPHGGLIPGHGPFDPSGRAAIAQTRDWIDWLDEALTQAVQSGLDMVEAGELPIPARFSTMAAARYELQRSVSHLYPGLEARLLPRIDRPG
ncbi:MULTISPECIES: quinoprotein relay system zinc metallohydrolase 1 [Sphingobium]|jgi:quinoprotein relay system zinc metallohydrolase 1|uniref:Metallo-beta-lactamase domain-containing protein n=2 Tax=Sphingobium fuliginis (strain ATCC 27551) TaxID=336203 RepID=A0A292ZLV7_SPHSA|nr:MULTISPECIES: quinoprotein relay system zinc metallohydrolase 1 [Sphingobium]AJR23752.1 hydrolase [Sphingobium sp. YBL2]PNP99846.1 hydrolase [Sphingobium sp. SA916]RYL96982.1 quinoprotein relay system zinc metallohydrolase 1 [Sphingobium fuliginis]UXC93181.1 quinoprotein relay system zinc metallohydrolase 1 [Sphingobium sp. RSMS]WDA35779.1 quinoprotein relay system zinc metallohydrolase 1 [Sphingobium sp. YC-XJ3]